MRTTRQLASDVPSTVLEQGRQATSPPPSDALRPNEAPSRALSVQKLSPNLKCGGRRRDRSRHGRHHRSDAALGTNRLGNSHQTVIASIVQQYSSHNPMSRRYFDLMISVRKESMEWDALSLVRLRRYIREALRF